MVDSSTTKAPGNRSRYAAAVVLLADGHPCAVTALARLCEIEMGPESIEQMVLRGDSVSPEVIWDLFVTAEGSRSRFGDFSMKLFDASKQQAFLLPLRER